MVLPHATWQARNRARGERGRLSGRAARRSAGDAGAPSVRAQRAAARLRRRPVRRCCASSTASGCRYDITTDLALATRRPALDRYTGVLFAGPPRFVAAPDAQRLLRAYVRRWADVSPGSAVAGSSGASAWRPATQPARGCAPPAPTRTLFGERLRLERGAGAGRGAERSRRLLRAACRASFGPFGPLEESPRAAAARAPAGVRRHRCRAAARVVVYRRDARRRGAGRHRRLRPRACAPRPPPSG